MGRDDTAPRPVRSARRAPNGPAAVGLREAVRGTAIAGPPTGQGPSAIMVLDQTSGRGFLAASALLFLAAATATVLWCGSMADAGLPMPGGWTLSMAWTETCARTPLAAAASFLGMWSAMMVAMMLPSLVPALAAYRRMLGATGRGRLGLMTAIVGAGYFLVWSAIGLAVYPAGLALAGAATDEPALARAVPVVGGVVVLAAGLLQFTAWKARRLAACRAVPLRAVRPPSVGAALADGLRLGARCAQACAGPMAVLLVLGVMDLAAMAAVTAAITAERLAPTTAGVARATGTLAVAAGLALIVRAAMG